MQVVDANLSLFANFLFLPVIEMVVQQKRKYI